ncbi:hypothetical protein [Streptomyces sp. NPDC002276]
MAAPVRNPPNVLFSFAGAVVFVAGLGLMVFGLVEVVRGFADTDAIHQLNGGSGPDYRQDQLKPIINGMSALFVGGTVLTVGRYLWRGARRRGWRDRLGRLLIIIGYLVIGVALYVGTRFMVAMAGANSGDEAQQISTNYLIAVGAIGFPGALLVFLGLRLAREVPLMGVSVTAE